MERLQRSGESVCIRLLTGNSTGVVPKAMNIGPSSRVTVLGNKSSPCEPMGETNSSRIDKPGPRASVAAQVKLRAAGFILFALIPILIWIVVPRAADGQRFEARLFGQDDGLNNLAISSIAQDPKGFLWVATQNGLFRYDGARFQSFGATDGLSDPSVLTLLVDQEGTLWAGTHTGLFWFDGTAFQELRIKGSSLNVGTNSMIASTKAGEVVVATPEDLLSIERESAKSQQQPTWSILPYRLRHPSFPIIDDRNGIGVDRTGKLWIGCGEAICSFDGSLSRTFDKTRGVPADYYVSFFLARDGRMYARGRNNIVTWNQGDTRIADLTRLFPPQAIKTVHRRFAQDRFGHILTPTASGFATWDGNRWLETTRTSKGDIDGASEVFSDREGTLWIGTEGSGLLESLGYAQWKNYGTAEGLADPHVFAIAIDRSGARWVGHEKGLSRLEPDGTSFGYVTLSKHDDISHIESLAPSPDGGMWVGALLVLCPINILTK